MNALALQADGRILLGGAFTTLNGQARSCIARVHADGSLDPSFNPGVGPAPCAVICLVIQADGKVLMGGVFSAVSGQPRKNLARLNNTEPATQSLTFDGSTISWQRGGTSPEVWQTTFDVSSNGTDWTRLGAGSRIPGGWQLTNVSLPSTAMLRARGALASACIRSGSGGFVESQSPVAQTRPVILWNDSTFGFRSNQFGFEVRALPGQIVIVEISADLSSWIPLATNTVDATPWHFTDSAAASLSQRFYRGRLR